MILRAKCPQRAGELLNLPAPFPKLAFDQEGISEPISTEIADYLRQIPGYDILREKVEETPAAPVVQESSTPKPRTPGRRSA